MKRSAKRIRLSLADVSPLLRLRLENWGFCMFSGTIDFDPDASSPGDTLTSTNQDGFLLKIDAAGAFHRSARHRFSGGARLLQLFP